MDHRTIKTTAAVLAFLKSQPREFTAEEIYEHTTATAHVDADADDIAYVCGQLANSGFITVRHQGDYVAYKGYTF